MDQGGRTTMEGAGSDLGEDTVARRTVFQRALRVGLL